MYEVRRFILLLTPSFASLILCICSTGALFGLAAWHQINTNPAVREYLSGAGASSRGFHSLLDSIFTQNVAYNLLLVAGALAVALAVYMILSIVEKGLAGALESLVIVRQARGKAKEVGERYGVRVLALVLWIIYLLFTFKTLLPVCLLSVKTGIGAAGYGGIALAYAVLLLGTHVHVILVRLMYLRPRLFGGSDDYVAARLT